MVLIYCNNNASTTGNIRILHYLERSKQKNLTKTPRTWVQWRVSQYISVYSIKFSNLFWTVLLHLFSFSIFLQCQSLFLLVLLGILLTKNGPFQNRITCFFFSPRFALFEETWTMTSHQWWLSTHYHGIFFFILVEEDDPFSLGQ